MRWAWEVVLGGVDVANPLANSLGWADGNRLLWNSIPLSVGGLREEPPWSVPSMLLARGSFVPILPGLGVSELAFPGHRLGPADEGTRGPNGCWIAGTSLDIFCCQDPALDNAMSISEAGGTLEEQEAKMAGLE